MKNGILLRAVCLSKGIVISDEGRLDIFMGGFVKESLPSRIIGHIKWIAVKLILII